MSLILTAIAAEQWAISPQWLETIQSIAMREGLDLEALEAKLGRPIENSYKMVERNGVAILPINGPLMARANLFDAISGATSYQMIARDFNLAMDNPDIRGIISTYATPGGMVAGANELGDMFYQARGRKPHVAYVGEQAASAGYWAASAADSIAIDPTAILGSIGVVATLTDRSESEEQKGVKKYVITSDQSPRKALDPKSETDRGDIKALLNQTAGVFIDAVARNRDVTPEKVMQTYGRGGLLIGQTAIDVGMADRISSLEAEIQAMQDSGDATAVFQPGAAGQHTGEKSMTEATKTTQTAADSVALEAAKAEGFAAGAKAERERVSAILEHPEAAERGATALQLALSTDMTPEAAGALLATLPKDQTPEAAGPSAFEQHMAKEGDSGVQGDHLAAGGNGDPEQFDAHKFWDSIGTGRG